MGKPPKSNGLQGVVLVERVIEKVKAEGFDVLGRCGLPKTARPKPIAPAVLKKLRFPNGSDLSPSLKRWLAFDGSWLPWFDNLARPAFKPKKLGQYARDEYNLDWGYGSVEPKIGGDCFGLHFGSDSRRFLYVGKPDSIGEHPVLLVDTDDSPYLGVEYPGIDVYLGVHSGVVERAGDTYGTLAKDPRYAARMKEHARLNLLGKSYIDIGYGHGQFAEEDEMEPVPSWKEGDPVPKGFRVGFNPFTKQALLQPKTKR